MHPVPAALAPCVRGIHGYRITGCMPGTHLGLPSAAVTCVFDLGDGLDLSGLNLRGISRFLASFSGLHNAPATIHHDGSQHGIMLYLTPPGLHELFGIPASELRGSVVDLAELLGRMGTELTERVRSAPGWTSLDVLSEILLRQVPHHPRDGVAAQVGSRLEGTRGGCTVTSLARESGRSARYLHARFSAEFGLGPKAAARIMRFERSVDTIQQHPTLAQAAFACGYADQAHLAREWRQFAGITPSRSLGLEEFAPIH